MITLGNDTVGVVGGGNGRFRNRIEIFDIKPGTKRLVIPAGWNKIRVAVIGAGGGSAPTGAVNVGPGGGGGGGYAERVFAVREGEVYIYNVGKGEAGAPGGTSTFGSILAATGGDMATVGSISPDVTAKGGVGGAGTGGETNTLGGKGGDGTNNVAYTNLGGGGGGASGHRYGNGGPGQVGQGVYPGSGNSPAGGRGGSWENNNSILLYDDGWGLGITRYDQPLEAPIGNIVTTVNWGGWWFAEVGEGSSSPKQVPNYGGGGFGNDGSGVGFRNRAGIGGGGGGRGGQGGNEFGLPGPGAVIIEVLE